MHRKRFSWVALVGIGLAGVVAVSAAASTLAARSTASPLEIVFHGRHEPMPPNAFATVLHVGTFTSGAPSACLGPPKMLDGIGFGLIAILPDSGSTHAPMAAAA
jgi:hypothetical protein